MDNERQIRVKAESDEEYETRSIQGISARALHQQSWAAANTQARAYTQATAPQPRSSVRAGPRPFSAAASQPYADARALCNLCFRAGHAQQHCSTFLEIPDGQNHEQRSLARRFVLGDPTVRYEDLQHDGRRCLRRIREQLRARWTSESIQGNGTTPFRISLAQLFLGHGESISMSALGQSGQAWLRQERELLQEQFITERIDDARRRQGE